jgi:hypothetical protein
MGIAELNVDLTDDQKAIRASMIEDGVNETLALLGSNRL